MTSDTSESGQSRILIWDWTVRFFHWLTVLLVICMWSTADKHDIWKTLDQFLIDAGVSEYGWGAMGFHQRFGMCLLFLLIFRIYWGVFGSATARFAGFIKGPGAIVEYVKTLKTRPYKPGVGHSPLGALSVVALLIVLVSQLTTGMFTVDVDGIESGPLSHLVDFDTGRLFADLHEMSFRALYILIGLHILAVLFYQLYLKANLVIPMITGKRPANSVVQKQSLPPVRAPILAVGIGVVLSGVMVWLIWT
ncbi:MAG: Ni/Fe-hydrogenase 1 b-type cytochrome subunit [Ponticaulis sp.]|nr:Ni/Fe-hydrogenase 1 b-type cytochrome subunit [Ponticaulis sp.]|tara:strand:- start:2374 stop:3123 length:750 start_codon:yes stop_codon:yes gene_type:complete